ADGECGRLVGPEDVDALAEALVELGGDPGLRRRLGEAAERRAEAFSAAVASEKLLAVYAALVRDKGLGDSPRSARRGRVDARPRRGPRRHRAVRRRG